MKPPKRKKRTESRDTKRLNFISRFEGIWPLSKWRDGWSYGPTLKPYKTVRQAIDAAMDEAVKR